MSVVAWCADFPLLKTPCVCLQIIPTKLPNAGARRDPPDQESLESAPAGSRRAAADYFAARVPSELGPVRLNRVLGGAALVVMVQATDFANFDHLSFLGRLYSPGLRGVLG